MTRLKAQSSLGLAPVALMLAACAADAPDTAASPVERPEDVWAFIRDEAAAKGARPDRTMTYTNAGLTHRIEVFQTEGPSPSHLAPGVVLFHGGAWREGAPVQFYRQARVLADAGYVVALPEYATRNEDGATPRDSVNDAFKAWAVIRGAADHFGIDPARLYAGGASAGGQMAAALATLEAPVGIEDHVQPAGLILFNPVIDNGPDGYGHGRLQDYWEDFSPLHNIGEPHPDTLFLIGDSDPLIPVETAERYCAQVRETGSTCETEVFAGAGHAWFNYDPAGYDGTLTAMLATLQAWSQIPQD